MALTRKSLVFTLPISDHYVCLSVFSPRCMAISNPNEQGREEETGRDSEHKKCTAAVQRRGQYNNKYSYIHTENWISDPESQTCCKYILVLKFLNRYFIITHTWLTKKVEVWVPSSPSVKVFLWQPPGQPLSYDPEPQKRGSQRSVAHQVWLDNHH